jgi:hypothetical protein
VVDGMNASFVLSCFVRTMKGVRFMIQLNPRQNTKQQQSNDSIKIKRWIYLGANNYKAKNTIIKFNGTNKFPSKLIEFFPGINF